MHRPPKWIAPALAALTLVCVLDAIGLFHDGEVRHGVVLSFLSVYALGWTYLETLWISERVRAVKAMYGGLYFFGVAVAVVLSRLSVGSRLLAVLFPLALMGICAREAVRRFKLASPDIRDSAPEP
jgi:hypothetical protein